MSDPKDPDENPTAERPQVSPVQGTGGRVDAQELPSEEFLGLSPGDANKETDPGDPLVPDQA